MRKTYNNQEELNIKNLKKILGFLKVIVVLVIAGLVTYLSDGFHYFEHIEKGVEYGVHHGFPLPFYFEGYHINWGTSPDQLIADWVQISRWNYVNMVLDYIIYAVFAGGVLFLVDKGLKKVLKIDW